MDPDREKQVLAQALARGMVTAEQVEACARQRAEDGAAESLLTRLLQQGHLSREQVIELVTGKPAAPAPAAPPEPESPAEGPESIPLDEAIIGLDDARLDEPSDPEPFILEEPAAAGEPPRSAPAEAPQAADARPPMPAIDECELVADLGSGPLTTTCVVRDKSGRQFVLKVLHAAVARQPGLVEQVHRQADAAAGLGHPNLAKTLGSGQLRGDTFVLSEHVDGASLQQLIDGKGKLSVDEALAIGVAVAAALEQARAAGLHHGAVTPNNILVGNDGNTCLADLGLPKPPPDDFAISRTGAGIRSPHHLSPEHTARGRVSVRSDLFSLGACLYHGLTGRPPFAGDTTAEVIGALRRGDCAPVRDLAPDVPRALEAIVHKLLRPAPAERYQTPRELLDDLAAFHAGKVPAAQRAAVAAIQTHKAEEQAAEQAAADAAPDAAAPPPRRRWPWVAAAAALALLLGGGIWLATRPAATRPPQPDAKDGTPGVVDPITLARQGTQELDEAVQAHKPQKGKELETAQETIEAIQAIREKYKGTAVAKEAGKKLVPFQAEALFQTALAFAQANPSKRSETIQRYHDVVSRFGNTEAGWKAERELDKLEGAARKKVQQRFDAESQKAARLLEKHRFGQALALYDALLKEQGKSVEEAVLAEKLILTSKAEEAYQKIDQQAQESINRRSYTEAKALYTQVADTFGLEPYVGRAKAEIAVIEPLLAGASRRRLKAIDAAKYEFFLVRTEPSLALARKWELKAARQEAEKLRPDLVAADIEPYLDDYLGDLDLLASLKQRVVRRLNDKKRPVLTKAFSLGKVGGRFDPKWLESTVLAADDIEMVVRYGEVDVHRQWGQCPPDELYRLSKMAVDVALPQNRLALGVACLYAGLYRTAETELNGARAAGAEHVEPYLKRLQLSRPTVSATPDAVVARTQDEQASQLLMEAKRFMGERAWDRALYRLALLRARHASKDYDLSANLADIDQRIAQCRKHVDRMEMEADLALGRAVRLLRLDDLDDWQRTFGTWGLRDGVLRGDAADQQDGECLFTLQHAPSYELRLKARIVKGTGAIIRLAGKTRPNIGFWLHAQNPKLTGLLMAQATDDKPAERVRKALPIKLNEWIDVRAVVCPSFVEVAIGPTYRARMDNKLPARHDAVQTYGVVVNAGSTAELRDLSVRVLQEQ